MVCRAQKASRPEGYAQARTLTYSETGPKGQALVDSKIVIKVQPDVFGDSSYLLNILISAANDTKGFICMAVYHYTCWQEAPGNPYGLLVSQTVMLMRIL